MSAGSASPAEMQRRSRVRSGARTDARIGQHRCEQRRHAGEDRRLMALHRVQHRIGRRPVRQQHGARADRHREGHAIAKPIGMERLGRGEDQVVRADLQHLRAIGIGRRAQAAMNVPHAFRRPGGARGIQPERHLVRRRDRGRCRRIAAGKEFGQPDRARIVDRCGRAAVGLRHDDPAQVRDAVQHRQQRRDQRCRDHQRIGAAVGQDVADHLMGQQRVDRHRHDAGTDRAPERDREIHRIEQQQRDAPLACHAGRAQGAGEAAGRRRQLAIGQRPPGIAERHRIAAPSLLMAIDEIFDRVAVVRHLWPLLLANLTLRMRGRPVRETIGQ